MANIYDMADTWNDGATAFNAIKMDVTNTASAAGSLLLDLQIGSASAFSVGLDLIEKKRGTNAQLMNVYGTFTDASNYERLAVGYDSGNSEFTILGEKAGTGARRDIRMGNDLVFLKAAGSTGVVLSGWNDIVDFQFRGSTRFSLTASTFQAESTDYTLGADTKGWGALWLGEQAADPANPTEGNSVIWQSNGTGSGDDGDIMMKITAGGVTKAVTIVDFSAAA